MFEVIGACFLGLFFLVLVKTMWPSKTKDENFPDE